MGVAQSFAALGRVVGPLAGGVLAVYNLGFPFIVSGIVTLFILMFGSSYLRFISDERKTT